MEFKSDALEFGSAIHLTLAEYYRAKMTGDRLLLKDVHESYRQHWTNRVKDRSDIKYADQKDFQSYLIEGADLLTAWFNKLPDGSFLGIFCVRVAANKDFARNDPVGAGKGDL
jgi:putative RecB family exonuclease